MSGVSTGSTSRDGATTRTGGPDEGDRARRRRSRARAWPLRRRHGRPEVDGFRAVRPAAGPPDASRPRQGDRDRAARRGQRGARVDRPEDPRPRHRPDLLRALRSPDARRRHEGAGGRGAPGPRRRAPRRHARADGRRAGPGCRLRRRPQRPAPGARGLRRLVGAVVAAGLPAQRRHPEHRAADAQRRRGQDQPAAAALLRQAAARRAAEPGHQRHRQHQPDPAADDEPAAVRGAHRRRCAVDDVLDLAAAGPGRARHGAASPWSSPA